MTLLVRPSGKGRTRLLCHSPLCRRESVWLAGIALTCLRIFGWFIGFFACSFDISGVVLRVFGWVGWGFFVG